MDILIFPPYHDIFSVKNKNASPGEILQEGRVHSGLSINQVEQITKIRLSYLEAIEHDDFPKLPPVVYVTAYIKTLCSLYNISSEDTALVLSNLKKSGEDAARTIVASSSRRSILKGLIW